MTIRLMLGSQMQICQCRTFKLTLTLHNGKQTSNVIRQKKTECKCQRQWKNVKIWQLFPKSDRKLLIKW